MNLVLHRIGDVALLHLCAVLCGMISAVIYLIVKSIPRFLRSVHIPKFPRFLYFNLCFEKTIETKLYLIFSDILICLTMSCILISITFVLNSGNFRILSIGSMLTGYFLGLMLFSKPVMKLLCIVFYLFKLIIDTVVLPLSVLKDLSTGLFKWLFGKLISAYRERIIKTYTKSAIKKAAQYAENGFIDNYEEYIK